MTIRKAKNTTIAIASEKAGTVMARFEAVEREAQKIHEQQMGTKLARALLSNGSLHLVLSDGKATVEVANGAVALSVKQENEELENETE